MTGTATTTLPQQTSSRTSPGDDFHHHAIGPWTSGAVTVALCGYRRVALSPSQAARKPGCSECEDRLSAQGKDCLAGEVA